MRRIFVGDVHGCLVQLDALLAAVEFRPGTDVLHPVGDLVNRGPDSDGVLRRMIELGAEPVLGNHDLWWLQNAHAVDPAFDEWLRAQPVVRVFDDVIVVHAALHPHWDERMLAELASPELDSADVDFAVNVRYCTAEGERPPRDWPPPAQPFAPWDTFYSGTKRVVFGHWARRGLDVTDTVTALDSGCVYGRALSAWIPEEDRIVQVPGL